MAAQQVSVEERQVEMDQYVARYETRLAAAASNYQAKQSAFDKIEGKGLANREDVNRARTEMEAAKSAYEIAKADRDEAKKYAEKEMKKAEKAEAKQAKKEEQEAEGKSGHKILKGAAAAAGILTLGVAGGAVVGLKKVGDIGEKSRLMVNNTASYISMSFAKNILGYEGSRLPEDPTRRTWDPSMKARMKQGGCHHADCQPSFV